MKINDEMFLLESGWPVLVIIKEINGNKVVFQPTEELDFIDCKVDKKFLIDIEDIEYHIIKYYKEQRIKLLDKLMKSDSDNENSIFTFLNLKELFDIEVKELNDNKNKALDYIKEYKSNVQNVS